MNVILLWHDAVFVNAGSYDIIPKSLSFTLICRRSRARIVSCVMGISYWRPVRLSVMESVSRRVLVAVSLPVAGSALVGFIAQPLPNKSRIAGRLAPEFLIYTISPF